MTVKSTVGREFFVRECSGLYHDSAVHQEKKETGNEN
jgi:hypothetical protein